MSTVFWVWFSVAVSVPTAPCILFPPVNGLERELSNGVRRLPLDVFAEKLKTKVLGRLRLTLPLVVLIDMSPAFSKTVQNTLALVELMFALPFAIFASMCPLAVFAKTLPFTLPKNTEPLLVLTLVSPFAESREKPPLVVFAVMEPVARPNSILPLELSTSILAAVMESMDIFPLVVFMEIALSDSGIEISILVSRGLTKVTGLSPDSTSNPVSRRLIFAK